MIYLTEKSIYCDAKLVIRGKSASIIANTSRSVAKDSVKKHVHSIQHKEAEKLKTKSDLEAETYKENVVENTPIGENLTVRTRKD